MDAALDPGAISAIDDATLALAVAAALGTPLSPDGAMLRTDATPDTTAHMRLQHGFSGSSVVTPSTCAAYAWSGLTATVTLTGCTLESTGMPVTGSVSVAVALHPVSFVVTVTTLVVGGTTYDGSVMLHINATDAANTPPSLDVDLTTTNGTTMEHLTATGLTVTTSAMSMAIAGSASLTSGATTTSITATGLTWQMGQCLPSSGTAAMTVGSGPTTTQMLFTPCR